jgi:TRAP transporter TAXI family solute receptor
MGFTAGLGGSRVNRPREREDASNMTIRIARRTTVAVAFAAALGTMGLAPGAAAQDPKLPPSLTMTAYDTGSSGFSQVVALGKMFKDKYNIDVRALPAGNDIARLAPLRTGRAQISAMGIGGFFAMEGMFEFGSKDWGPQRLQLLVSAMSCNGAGLGVAKDTGVKEMKDLRGKRLGIVVGSPALNVNAYSMIAFGGLTAADMKLVEFSSYGAMWKGMVNNEVDAAIASTISGQAREMDASPRGLVWPPTPHSDAEGWARLQRVGPYYTKHVATCGAGGISAQNPIEIPFYPYPIWMTYATQQAELVHAVMRAKIRNYDSYKDSVPGLDGLEAKRQPLTWVMPYHPGAVAAYKEAGIWTAEAEKHNQGLMRRQDVLGAAWDGYLKTNPPAEQAAFYKGWLSARAAALQKAGLPAIFE